MNKQKISCQKIKWAYNLGMYKKRDNSKIKFLLSVRCKTKRERRRSGGIIEYIKSKYSQNRAITKVIDSNILFGSN
jgi:hypothetical protein